MSNFDVDQKCTIWKGKIGTTTKRLSDTSASGIEDSGGDKGIDD